MPQLKLLALDHDDLQVISACCQDAVLKAGDLQNLAAENRFVLSLNRFVWERAENKKKDFERRRSVLHFERVNSVKVQGIDHREKDMVLCLLSVIFEPGDKPGGTIELVFAGDGAIRLGVECVEAQLTDMPAAWQAKSRPAHAGDDN